MSCYSVWPAKRTHAWSIFMAWAWSRGETRYCCRAAHTLLKQTRRRLCSNGVVRSFPFQIHFIAILDSGNYTQLGLFTLSGCIPWARHVLYPAVETAKYHHRENARSLLRVRHRVVRVAIHIEVQNEMLRCRLQTSVSRKPTVSSGVQTEPTKCST